MSRFARVLVVGVVVLVGAACSRGSGVQATGVVPPPPCNGDRFEIDLADVWEAHPESDPEEQREQYRDWIWTALAGRLEQNESLDGLLRGSVLQPTIRDEAFAHALEQPVGPTRAGSASNGVFVVMVEDGDRKSMSEDVLEAIDHEHFLVGDMPSKTLVYRYSIDSSTAEARVCRTAERNASWVRSKERGFIQAEVRTAKQLEDFLAGGVDLLGAQCTSTGLELTGRKRRRASLAPITVEHIAALWPHRTRAYREKRRADLEARKSHATFVELEEIDAKLRDLDSVGFSLDPKLRSKDAVCRVKKFRSSLPDKRKFAAFLEASNAAAFDKLTALEHHAELRRQASVLPTIETILAYSDWHALGYARTLRTHEVFAARIAGDLLKSDEQYQCARYDGPLRGTSTGMTLFYTDLLMKLWGFDFSGSAPTATVPGFESVPDYPLPAVHCANAAAAPTSRMWLALRDDRYLRESKARTSFSPIATKLFGKGSMRGADYSSEVEQAEPFARLFRWWNARYGLVAEQEPQFELLNQILKWSVVAATAELENHRGCLSLLESVRVDETHRFDDWVASTPDLSWRGPVDLVHKDSEPTECIPTLFSRTYESCGDSYNLSGGVSAADAKTVRAKRVGRTKRSPSLGRLAPEHGTAVVDGRTFKARTLAPAGRDLANVAIDLKTGDFSGEIGRQKSARGKGHHYGGYLPLEVSKRIESRPDQIHVFSRIGIGRLKPGDVSADQLVVSKLTSDRLTITAHRGTTSNARALGDAIVRAEKRGVSFQEAVLGSPGVERAWKTLVPGNENWLLAELRTAEGPVHVSISKQGPRGPPVTTDITVSSPTARIGMSIHNASAVDALLRSGTVQEVMMPNRRTTAVPSGLETALDNVDVQAILKLHREATNDQRHAIRMQVRFRKRQERGKDTRKLDELLLKMALPGDGAATPKRGIEGRRPPADATTVYSPQLPNGKTSHGPGGARESYVHYVLDASSLDTLPPRVVIDSQTLVRSDWKRPPRSGGVKRGTLRTGRVYVAYRCRGPDEASSPDTRACPALTSRANAATSERKAGIKLKRLSSQLSRQERRELDQVCTSP